MKFLQMSKFGNPTEVVEVVESDPPPPPAANEATVELGKDDWVIQNAGNSGVGRSVIAFAQEFGLRSVSLVRRPELVDELKSAGADVVLVDGPDVVKQVAAATGNAKIKLGIDGVGG